MKNKQSLVLQTLLKNKNLGMLKVVQIKKRMWLVFLQSMRQSKLILKTLKNWMWLKINENSY